MAALEIPCPQCGKKLRLPDRALLGRKGRCGKCGHKFIMHEPPVTHFAEVPDAGNGLQFEFAGAEEDPDSGADKTLMGISARYIPDEPVSREPVAPRTAAPEPVARQVFEESAFPDVMLESGSDEDGDAVAKLRVRRQQLQRRRMIVMGVSAIVLIAAGIGLYVGLSGKPNANLAKKGSPAKSRAVEDGDAESPAESRKSAAAADKPPDPITLKLIPEGAKIVIHLRPAELWRKTDSAEEFRACLGPLGVWLESALKTQCLLEPANIEEAVFALIPASREAFDVAVVVRAKGDLKRSDLIDKFNGELVDKPRSHYIGAERAWMVFDNRTFASAPASMAQSMIESADSPPITSDGVQALLSMTDRKRHFTLVCDLEDVRLGVNTLAPENARKFLEGIVDFFGDDVETVAWSLQLGEADTGQTLQSDIKVRNRLSRSPQKLQADLKKKLADLPEEVLSIVRMTHPKKIGEKKIVGRYPIMTKILERSTHFDTGHRLVSLKVDLPERAGPNLALGTLLTWNQTTLPDFGTSSTPAPAVAARQPNLPDKIADRLKKKITVDFRREFLYKAMEFISEETGVTIKLDGPGMKDVGITQNEYQIFAMEDVPATAVLHKILIDKTTTTEFPNGKLALIVDEDAKTATITGVNFAKNKKQTPFPLEPAPNK